MGRWEPDAPRRLAAGGDGAVRRAGVRDRQPSRRSPGARDSPSERSSATSPTSARCCSRVGVSSSSLLVETVANAPPDLAAIDAAAAGIEAAAALLQQRRAFARQRQAVIAANPDLQERELIKLASLSAALARTLRTRRCRDTTADLVAEVAIAVFRSAFQNWIDESNQQDFPHLIRELLDELRAVTAGV